MSTLQELAANNVGGYQEPFAKKFVKEKDLESLGLMQSIQEIEKSINTKGRVPGIKPEYIKSGRWGHLVPDPSISGTMGQKAYYERYSGTVRGHTRFIYADKKGAVFRTDCYAMPEMWLEAHLTWEELEDVMKKRPI